MSHFKNLTPAQQRMYWEYLSTRSNLRPEPVIQRATHPQYLQPQRFYPSISAWGSHEDRQYRQTKLPRKSTLKIVSWNLDAFAPSATRRAVAALDHLKEVFGTHSRPPLVMLQEVNLDTLDAIRSHLWTRENFELTDSRPPSSVYETIRGESFVYTVPVWKAAPYFTLMMIPRSLSILGCFRVPFVSKMGRDALFVDIPVSTGLELPSKTSIRLCTTHLECLYEGGPYRSSQLSLISNLLKQQRIGDHYNIGGLVGGDMNSITPECHDLNKSAEIDLKDVWEDEPPPPIPERKPFKKDLTYGRARGNTWGYQSEKSRNRKRLDKFLYTGRLATVALSEPQDVTGRLGRVGIGCKTEIDKWEWQPDSSYGDLWWPLSDRELSRMNLEGREVRCSKTQGWVSDHFGIAVGIQIS